MTLKEVIRQGTVLCLINVSFKTRHLLMKWSRVANWKKSLGKSGVRLLWDAFSFIIIIWLLTIQVLRALPFESGLNVPSSPLFYRGSTAIPRPRFKVQELLYVLTVLPMLLVIFIKPLGVWSYIIIYRKYMETTETMETYIYWDLVRSFAVDPL